MGAAASNVIGGDIGHATLSILETGWQRGQAAGRVDSMDGATSDTGRRLRTKVSTGVLRMVVVLGDSGA